MCHIQIKKDLDKYNLHISVLLLLDEDDDDDVDISLSSMCGIGMRNEWERATKRVARIIFSFSTD